MADSLLYLDSFDHWQTTPDDVTRKWTTRNGAAVAIGTGRHGNGLRLGNPGRVQITYEGPAEGYSTITVGFAYQSNTFGEILNVIGPSFQGHQLIVNADGRISFVASSNQAFDPPAEPAGGVLTSEKFISVNNWFYIELQIVMSAPAAERSVTATVKVNEEVWINGTVTKLIRLGNDYMTNVALSNPGGSFLVGIFDDMYITTGEFLGDITVGCIYPDAEGFYQDFTANPGPTHWDMVNDGGGSSWPVGQYPNDLTTYLLAASSGLKEIHNYEDIGSFPIKGVQMLSCEIKSDVGSASTRHIYRNGAGTDFVDTDIFYPSDNSWIYHRRPWRVSVFTSTDWTTAEINALQFGIERTL